MAEGPSAAPKKSRALIFVILDAPAEIFELNGLEMSVLTSLASFLNPKRRGFEVWPSINTLSSLSGFSVPSVRRALQKLHVTELIKIRSHSGRSNTYTINSGVIHSLADPYHTDRGSDSDPYHTDRGSDSDPYHTDRGSDSDPYHPDSPAPVTQIGDPSHPDSLTAHRTTELNSSRSNLGCSRNSVESDNPAQRKLAVHGLVSDLVDNMQVGKEEQPTKGKTKKRAGGNA